MENIPKITRRKFLKGLTSAGVAKISGLSLPTRVDAKNGNEETDLEQGVKERKKVLSSSLLKETERDPKNFLTEISSRLLTNVFDIPTGAFSGLGTYDKKDEEGRVLTGRISPEFDKLIAETFTNYRYIVRRLNDIGPITTKDPREKYELEGWNMDELLDRTKKDLGNFREIVGRQIKELERKKEEGKISEDVFEKSMKLLSNGIEVYNILIGEIGLKKRGFKFVGLGGSEIDFVSMVTSNYLLEIKYLPGGNIIILRGYMHHSAWQRNFGDSRYKDYGLSNIYKKVDYVAIESSVNMRLGEGLKNMWKNVSNKHYGILMRELVENGFGGKFLEVDSRFQGVLDEFTFDKKILTNKEAEILFSYIQRYNPELAKEIKTTERFIEFFHKQRFADFKESLAERVHTDGLSFITDGTYYHSIPSVKENLKTSSIPTGFELGTFSFSDALSVIKILLMNKAINDSGADPVLIAEFQGAKHLSNKSFFFDNPQYAMEVVLTNIHEIIPHLPNIQNREDILEKLQNMDTEAWKLVFVFIGLIPRTKVAESTDKRNKVEPGEKQRQMSEPTFYSAVAHLTDKEQKELDKIIAQLVDRGK